MDAVLGIDVGTTAVKAMLLTRDGRPLPAHAAAYGLHSPQPGWFEQNPMELQAAMNQAVHAALNHADNASVCGIGLSTQAAATLLLNASHVPMTPIISWMDVRASESRRSLTRKLGSDAIFARTGRSDAGILAPLLAWLAQHAPHALEQTVTLSSVEDFVCRWLTGESGSDASNAAITGMLNLATLDWDELLADAVGLDVDKLPPLRQPDTAVGRLTSEAASALHLPVGIPVCAPLHDQHAAALGAGILRAGQAMLSTGTAWVLFTCTDNARLDLGGRLFRAPTVDGDGWGLIDALAAGSGYYDRAMTWLGLNAGDYPQAEDLATSASPNAGGVCFLPTLGGERAAAWTGLSLSHQRGDLLRAVMNGLACEAVLAAKKLAGEDRLTELVMLGGAARSTLWPKIVAAVAGLPVHVPQLVDAAALGAAVQGGVAADWWPDARTGRQTISLPTTIVQPPDWGPQILASWRIAHQMGSHLTNAPV